MDTSEAEEPRNPRVFGKLTELSDMSPYRSRWSTVAVAAGLEQFAFAVFLTLLAAVLTIFAACPLAPIEPFLAIFQTALAGQVPIAVLTAAKQK